MRFCPFKIIFLLVLLYGPTICWSSAKAPDSSFFVKQLELDPSNCFNNEQLAITLEVEGDYEKAISQFKKTLAICKETSLLRLQMGVSYILSNKPEQGLLEMERAVYIAEENEDEESIKAIRAEVQSWKEHLNINK